MKGIMIVLVAVMLAAALCLTGTAQEDIGGITWEDGRYMINAAASFTDTTTYYHLTIDGTSGIDSTQYYRVKPDNFVMPEIADSDTVTTHVQVMVRSGFYSSVTDSYVMADVDSFTVSSTDQNDNPPQRLSIPKSEFFYLVARGYWGNGSARKLRFNLDRNE